MCTLVFIFSCQYENLSQMVHYVQKFQQSWLATYENTILEFDRKFRQLHALVENWLPVAWQIHYQQRVLATLLLLRRCYLVQMEWCATPLVIFTSLVIFTPVVWDVHDTPLLYFSGFFFAANRFIYMSQLSSKWIQAKSYKQHNL